MAMSHEDSDGYMRVEATPVHLVGLVKASTPKVSLKRKFGRDSPWPPPRPRAFRKLAPDLRSALVDEFKAIPAAVAAVPKEDRL